MLLKKKFGAESTEQQKWRGCRKKKSWSLRKAFHLRVEWKLGVTISADCGFY